MMTHPLLVSIGMLALFSPLILWGQNQSVDGFSHPMIQLIETSQGVGVHQSSLPQAHQVHLHADGMLDDTPSTGSHPTETPPQPIPTNHQPGTTPAPEQATRVPTHHQPATTPAPAQATRVPTHHQPATTPASATRVPTHRQAGTTPASAMGSKAVTPLMKKRVARRP